MSFYIKKYSGESELFNIKKFRSSLKRAGASSEFIDQLVLELKTLPSLRSTKEIYEFALSRLKQQNPALAARYNIKRALMDFGPSGFPFEHYIAALFEAQKYQTKTGSFMQGICITHEIDVIAIHDKKHLIIECKFHNEQGLTCNAKVPLYIKARFDDILQYLIRNKDTHEEHKAIIVTNTRFSSQAIAYAECVGISLLGWSYPEGAGLERLIDRFHLHPITALTSLNNHQKKVLLDNGLILCRDVEKQNAALDALHLSEQDKEHLLHEIMAVCTVKKM